jgi:hypothetical protein
VLISLTKPNGLVCQTGVSNFDSSNSIVSFVKFHKCIFTRLCDVKGLSSVTYRRVLPRNLSPYHPRILHIVHNTSHAFKVKQTQYFISIGTICTGACLTKKRVIICDISRGCPPSFTATASFSCGKPPVTTDLHVMTCVCLIIKQIRLKH